MVPLRGEMGLLISKNNQEVSNNCSSSNHNRIQQCMMLLQQMLYYLLRKSFISLHPVRQFLKMRLQQLSRVDCTLKPCRCL